VPAPAVIPAPIAYIKVVAVKKLVVGIGVIRAWSARLKGHVLACIHQSLDAPVCS